MPLSTDGFRETGVCYHGDSCQLAPSRIHTRAHGTHARVPCVREGASREKKKKTVVTVFCFVFLGRGGVGGREEEITGRPGLSASKHLSCQLEGGGRNRCRGDGER